jgi:polyhydroxyalkanoate synthesis regulator phasin
LENDEKKLRRREAIVAKQKVELYGVNNIGEIDQEKAKKLTEDLDLLEGLKLSVRHCEEVMAANKDRYPILEKTYNILMKGNKELREDIQELEEKIARLKAENE